MLKYTYDDFSKMYKGGVVSTAYNEAGNPREVLLMNTNATQPQTEAALRKQQASLIKHAGKQSNNQKRMADDDDGGGSMDGKVHKSMISELEKFICSMYSYPQSHKYSDRSLYLHIRMKISHHTAFTFTLVFFLHYPGLLILQVYPQRRPGFFPGFGFFGFLAPFLGRYSAWAER